MNLTKDQFLRLQELISRQTWLSSRAGALANLIFDECEHDDQKNLVSELLERFIFIKSDEFKEFLENLVLEIITTPGITASNTIIAAMAADSSPDSSQYLVQMIKTKLQEQRWNNVLIVNTFSSAYRKSKESGFTRTNIILVDEFLGSGQTATGRAAEIERQFKDVSVEIKIYVKVIFSSVVGVDALREKKLDLTCLKVIKRGISDFENGSDRAHKLNLMRELESQLSPLAGTHVLEECSLGYGQAESLFSIEELNTSNNVFPIFWWPERKDGIERESLLTRWLGR